MKLYIADLFNTTHDWDEINTWCRQQFGPHSMPMTPESRWGNSFNSSWKFRDKQDYVLFMLRWS